MSGRTNDKRVLVITGGSVLLAAPAMGPFDVVIAADSGVDSAFALGLAPHVVIGDLDSVSDSGLRRVREAGIDVLASPPTRTSPTPNWPSPTFSTSAPRTPLSSAPVAAASTTRTEC